MFVFKLGSGEIFAGVTGGLGRTQVHSCRTISRIYSGPGSGRQGADSKSPTGGQGIIGGSAGEGSAREGRQAAEEQETGKQRGRQGLDNRRVVRQTRVRKQAGSAL